MVHFYYSQMSWRGGLYINLSKIMDLLGDGDMLSTTNPHPATSPSREERQACNLLCSYLAQSISHYRRPFLAFLSLAVVTV